MLQYCVMQQGDFEGLSKQVQDYFSGEATGHDWFHMVRVMNCAESIARQEGADTELVKLIALMHDVGDHKFHPNESNASDRLIKEWMSAYRFSPDRINTVQSAVKQISFKGLGVNTSTPTKEAACVQDADRLDAIGAIGVARAFAYGGAKGRELYNPNEEPETHTDFEAYRKSTGHTINHFYEKLMHLSDRMQTETGKNMARERHLFMEQFLDRFYKEWEGKPY